MATPEIKVKIGADTAGFDKGIGGVQDRLSKFAAVAGTAAVAAVGALAAGMVALTKSSLANIDATTKQARSLGLTTQALQKMSLVAGEAGIETGKLTSMLGLMQRNIAELQQGTQTQVDAFAALGLSISDLQGLEPDKQFERIAESLDAIVDPTTKTATAMDIFGRSGREAINMLSDYSAKVANATEFQQRFGVAVGQDSAEAIERSNDAVGRLGMVMTGLGNRMAVLAAGPIEATANALVAFADKVMGANVTLEDFFGTLERAGSILGVDVTDALKDNSAAVVENAETIERLSAIYRLVANSAQDSIGPLRGFARELERAGAIPGAEMMRRFADEIEELGRQFFANEINGQQFIAMTEDATNRAGEFIQQLSGVDTVTFGNVSNRLGALGQLLLGLGQAARDLAASLPGAATPATPRTPGSQHPPAFESPLAPRTSSPPMRPPAMLDDYSLPPIATGGGGGGGGAMVDAFAQRLEALQESLATEDEVVAEWYEASQATLMDALERKALTEAEYRELRERLEAEHQDRLKGIRKIGEESAVSMAMGAGEEILSAIGQTNKKALKVAKVFGAAQALISAYQGAAKALTLPFPQNIAAAATVLAKGIGFVNAIRSVNDSGGGKGGGGGAATGGGGTQAPSSPMQVSLNTLGGGDFTSMLDLRQLLTGLNQAAGDRGYTILVPQ